MSSMTKPRKQRIQIAHLLGNPFLTHAEIAKIVGVCVKTVQRTLRENRPDFDAVEQKAAEYQISLRKRLPIKRRVEILRLIAENPLIHPFASLKAIERADALDGIRTDTDKGREVPRQTIQPMFAPAGGVQVAVTIGPQSATNERDITPPASDKKPEL